jgi:hypothetical protein
MCKLIVFLVLSMIIDTTYTMERSDSPEPKSLKKNKYLDITCRTRSVSSDEAPKAKLTRSDGLLKTPRLSKSPKRSESPDRNHTSIEQQLLKAVTDNDTVAATNILKLNLNIINLFGKTLLILAIEHDNKILVKELLAHRDIDVNKADRWDNTPLHYAALRNNEAVINLLLYDYRVNFFLKNKAKLFAHQLIDNKYLALRQFVFARTALDIIAIQEAFTLQINKEGNDAGAVNRAINTVRDRIARDHEHQKDHQALPEGTQLPMYATDKFIRKMILYRIKCQQEHDDL